MRIHIKEPYWGAGTKFGWDKGLGQHGISIRRKLLVGDLEVTIGKAPYDGKLYRVPVGLAEQLGKINYAKGTELVCFPTSILEEITNEQNSVPSNA